MENINTKKIETYQELKKRHHDELNEFQGMFFAFSNEQFSEGMIKIGLNADDTKAIVSIGMGGYLRKDRKEAFQAMFQRHNEEKKERKKEEKYLFDSLVYELRNHEYCVTYDPTDALDALGYKREDIDEKLLKKAIAESLIGCE